MEIIKGKGIVNDIAFGEIYILKNKSVKATPQKINDPKHEIERFNAAREETLRQLHCIHQKALKNVGKDDAHIFEVYQMMLTDPDFIEEINSLISEKGASAEYAVFSVGDNFSRMFSSMGNDIVQEKYFDIKGIINQILNILQEGDSSKISKIKKPSIIVADDLTPSQVVQFDRNLVSAFITKTGSSTSHMAILAKTLGIPAVILLDDQFDFLSFGKYAIVNGCTGEIFIDPDDATVSKLKKQKQLNDEQKLSLFNLKGKKSITLDGQTIEIASNISDPSDIELALASDAEAIGLCRSEFIFFNSKDFPTEDQQFTIYKNILKKMSPKRVVIRTLDIGSDKKVDYFNMTPELNPALGTRALRLSFKYLDIFKTQIRALLRASIHGNLAIMLPLVTSESEITQAKDIINGVKMELNKENIPYSECIEIGIMIETPAAVLISDILAKEVDFFSIGTNDLTQYTEAIDRQNPYLEDYFNPYHLSILRSVHMVVENAHKNNIWVGICGELAADKNLTGFFLSIGVDELSVSPPNVLSLRSFVRNCDVSKIRNKCLKRLKY